MRVLMKIIMRRRDAKEQWASQPDELQWREGLKINDIVDMKTWDGNWCLGQVVGIGRDPLLLLVIPNGADMKKLQYFNR